ncbi:MAG TPA: DUF542 domain-containing protein [Dehalococcoidia bacterium]|nr:DUF542 domain-containing protein [Dehalococcoidia bacterium]
MITKQDVINDVIKLYPKSIAVFNQYRVDSCCGGGQSIEKTATRDGVNMEALLKALNDVAAKN